MFFGFKFVTSMFTFLRVHIPTSLRDTYDYAIEAILLTIYFLIIVYLIFKTILDEKVINNKVVDLVE